MRGSGGTSPNGVTVCSAVTEPSSLNDQTVSCSKPPDFAPVTRTEVNTLPSAMRIGRAW